MAGREGGLRGRLWLSHLGGLAGGLGSDSKGTRSILGGLAEKCTILGWVLGRFRGTRVRPLTPFIILKGETHGNGCENRM